jgi:predicted dehydrogenase
MYKNVLVAYNRRHYSSTKYAKSFLDSHPNGLIKVTIPESAIQPDDNRQFPYRLPASVYGNSTHIFDLVNYLAGKVSWDYVSHITSAEKYLSVLAIGKGRKGSSVLLDMYFNAPANFSIDILSGNERIELSPIEIANYYKDMQVKDPTPERPIRTYVPTQVDQIIERGEEPNSKPGFLGQAEVFMNFCHGKKAKNSATLEDAWAALDVVEALVQKPA